MKISSKGHYGLLALAELADNYKMRRAVQVKEIASNQQDAIAVSRSDHGGIEAGHLVHGSAARRAVTCWLDRRRPLPSKRSCRFWKDRRRA